MKPILLYHGDCPDGFGAAFAFWLKYGDSMEYRPVFHKKEPFKGLPKSIFRNREVWMLDIALEREDTLKVEKLAKKYKVIDHHISNQENLGDLACCYFDMDHSGAILAWNECFPDQPAIKLLQYIEDRDLNLWKLPYSRELLTSVDAKEKTFEEWKILSDKIENPDEFAELIKKGSAILDYNITIMNNIKKSMYLGKIKGFTIPMVNTPFFRSELACALAEGYPFAAAYFFDGTDFIFSLRSSKDGENVAKIAQAFSKGGGHEHASGFSVKKLEDLNE